MSSAFDPTTFLGQETTEASVKRPPIAVGEYLGTIGTPDIRPWTGSKDPTKSGIACDYPVEIFVPDEERARLNLSVPTIKLKLGIMLDTKEDGKTLDFSPGKNAGLRRLREALNMNQPGEPFNLLKPVGRTASFKVGHREYEGELYEDIVGFSKAA